MDKGVSFFHPSDERALCQRYGIDMRQLARFETSANRAWFRDPAKYWHDAVFHADPVSD